MQNSYQIAVCPSDDDNADDGANSIPPASERVTGRFEFGNLASTLMHATAAAPTSNQKSADDDDDDDDDYDGVDDDGDDGDDGSPWS